MPKSPLTTALLIIEAKAFAELETNHDEPTLYGVTDGKAVGTYLEKKFSRHVDERYDYAIGNSASGIDFPSLKIDIKVTSIKQPQSSCPFRSASQKVYGLGYDLIVFVYEKIDYDRSRTSRLVIHHVIYVSRERTADFQTTSGVIKIIENSGNVEDIAAFFMDKNLPLDEIGAQALAERVLANPPGQGYLTISNALQWRLQYQRVITQAGSVDGIARVR